MKQFALLFFLFFLFSSCRDHDTVIGRVESLHYTPMRGGDFLKYKISYMKDGQKDSTYLNGGSMFIRGRLVVGDSIEIKLGVIQYFNKLVAVHQLVEREIKPVPASNMKSKGYVMRSVDVKPLLPDAKNDTDNEIIIRDYFCRQLQNNAKNIDESFLVYLRIDTLGKAYLEGVTTYEQSIKDIITNSVDGLPRFTVGMDDGRKVNVIGRYEIKKNSD